MYKWLTLATLYTQCLLSVLDVCYCIELHVYRYNYLCEVITNLLYVSINFVHDLAANGPFLLIAQECMS